MTPREIVVALGGGSHVAGQLGCRPSAISNWHRKGKGIPKSRWPDLVELAQREGVEGVTLEVLRRATTEEPHDPRAA